MERMVLVAAVVLHGLISDPSGAGAPVCPNAGAVLHHIKLSKTSGGFGGALDSFDRFGSGVASLGDLDGDGFGDIAVGAFLDDDGGQNRGAVWIVFLNADGTVKDERKISATTGGFGGVIDNFDRFGSSVASLGDVDGDDVTDLAVGVTLDDDGGQDPGAVWIVFLNADGTVKDEQKISDIEGGLVGELEDFDRFGIGVAPLGDLDDDGVPDLAVGAALDGDGGSQRGAVWVLFLNADGTVKDEQKISDTEGGFDGALDNADQFGVSVGALGDLDGDGVADLAVGANGDGDGGFARGAVWILFLNASGTVKAEEKISATAGGFGGVLDDGDAFGCSAASVGDLDGDGVADLAVGAFQDDDGGFDRGAVWIALLRADGTVKAERKISATSGGFGGAMDNFDNFGWCLGALGDFDGDGEADVAVGSISDDDGAEDAGAVWLLALDGCAFTCTGDLDGDGEINFGDLNTVLAGFNTTGPNLPGDVDDDGDVDFADLNVIVSAFNTSCEG